MKINENILSIPPYVSTTWKHINSIHMKGEDLVVALTSGESLVVPDLKKEVVDTIFLTHALYIDRNHAQEYSMPIGGTHLKLANPSFSALFEGNPSGLNDFPFKVDSYSIDEIGSILQHNPSQANTPELPPEILSKIVAITKIVAPDDSTTLPMPEANCNCVHCQISRAVHEGTAQLEETRHTIINTQEDSVSDEDLTFRQWDICQTGNKLYTVVNRLDSKEKYSVFLGQPLGCTCGKQNCEHLLAVLKS